MVVNVFSIYDSVAGKWSMPMCFENEATARRYFSNLMRENPDSQDFEIFYIGTFDCSNGKIVPIDNPVSVMKGEVKREVSN